MKVGCDFDFKFDIAIFFWIAEMWDFDQVKIHGSKGDGPGR